MQTRMRQMSFVAVVPVAFVVFLGGTALAQSSNSEVGNWKLNVAKSKFSPGTALTSATVKNEAVGVGIKSIVDAVHADGTVGHYQYTAHYDGKDNPIVGNADDDVVALTRVDASTIKLVFKKGGKITHPQTAVISNDGKIRTLTATGTDAQGQPVNNVLVWEKE